MDLFDNDYLSDIPLKINDYNGDSVTIFAHKSILILNSEFFSQNDSNIVEITIENINDGINDGILLIKWFYQRFLNDGGSFPKCEIPTNLSYLAKHLIVPHFLDFYIPENLEKIFEGYIDHKKIAIEKLFEQDMNLSIEYIENESSKMFRNYNDRVIISDIIGLSKFLMNDFLEWIYCKLSRDQILFKPTCFACSLIQERPRYMTDEDVIKRNKD